MEYQPVGETPSDTLPPPGFDRSPESNDARDAVQTGLMSGMHLPMSNGTQHVLEFIERNRVVVVDAATCSGKSTLMPLCLADQCLQLRRTCCIVVTQPRRLAAKGLARRVASETGTELGKVAGYRVGGDREDNGAVVVYVTVGHLLEALVHDPSHVETFSHITDPRW